ncbi:substrate-binding domain-containing protein, partial [Vibrio parahaemolyticus]|nr:substrate-binding domain-containing protein [Vibrio parahaemolyticus]
MTLRVAKVFSLLALACSGMAIAQDKPLPSYHKTTGIVGNLLSVGSDTLAGMTTLWVEEFKSIYPNINAQVQASGSSTAPPALTEQTAQFGPMSRPMRLREVEAFEREHGYKPTA